jgi:hypothetical protein
MLIQRSMSVAKFCCYGLSTGFSFVTVCTSYTNKCSHLHRSLQCYMWLPQFCGHLYGFIWASLECMTDLFILTDTLICTSRLFVNTLLPKFVKPGLNVWFSYLVPHLRKFSYSSFALQWMIKFLGSFLSASSHGNPMWDIYAWNATGYWVKKFYLQGFWAEARRWSSDFSIHWSAQRWTVAACLRHEIQISIIRPVHNTEIRLATGAWRLETMWNREGPRA